MKIEALAVYSGRRLAPSIMQTASDIENSHTHFFKIFQSFDFEGTVSIV